MRIIPGISRGYFFYFLTYFIVENESITFTMEGVLEYESGTKYT